MTNALAQALTASRDCREQYLHMVTSCCASLVSADFVPFPPRGPSRCARRLRRQRAAFCYRATETRTQRYLATMDEVATTCREPEQIGSHLGGAEEWLGNLERSFHTLAAAVGRPGISICLRTGWD